MIFQNAELMRMMVIFAGQPFIVGLYLFLGIKVIRKNPILSGRLFASYYFMIASAGILNIVYALIFDENIVKSLNFLTNLFADLSPIMILVAQLVLYKRFKFKKGITYLLTYLLLSMSFMYILTFFFDGVVINASTFWRPSWGVFFYLSVLAIMIIPIAINIVFSVKIYRIIPIGALESRKRWRYYMVGTIGSYSYLIFFNTFNVLLFKVIPYDKAWIFYVVLILIIPFWTVFLYKGIIQHRKIILQ